MSAISRLASEATRETARNVSRTSGSRRANDDGGFRGTMEKGLDAATQSVEAVRKACADSGLTVSGLTFSYNDELVWTPWGSYPDAQVQVKDGSGRLYSFDAELALASPGVTAQELREMMNSPGKPSESDLSPVSTTKPTTKEVVSAADNPTASVEAVRKACAESGLPVEGCTFSYNDDLVWTPWGGYRNPQVQITLPDGRLYSFNAELALLNPKLTAYELRQMQQMALPQDV